MAGQDKTAEDASGQTSRQANNQGVRVKRAKQQQVSSEPIALKILDSRGTEVATRAVSPEIFGVSVDLGSFHEVVRWQRAKKRAGTHAVKTRAEASGGGAKPWKQKGTGRARAGSNTSPLWVGGGIAHGPKARKYDFSLNRKYRRRVLCGALSERVREENCTVVKDFGLSQIKTKDAVAALRALGAKPGEGEKILVILSEKDQFAQKSMRNIEGVEVLTPAGLNVYDLLLCPKLVITEEALSAVEARLAPQRETRA